MQRVEEVTHKETRNSVWQHTHAQQMFPRVLGNSPRATDTEKGRIRVRSHPGGSDAKVCTSCAGLRAPLGIQLPSSPAFMLCLDLTLGSFASTLDPFALTQRGSSFWVLRLSDGNFLAFQYEQKALVRRRNAMMGQRSMK